MGGFRPAALLTLLKPSTVAAYVAAGFWGDETIYHVAARHARAIPQAFAVRDRHRRLNYSNPPARRSASCQPMIRSTTSSISAAITSLLPSTELAGAKLSRSGPKSPAWVGTKFLMHTASPLLSS
jgi:hypothetical protein